MEGIRRFLVAEKMSLASLQPLGSQRDSSFHCLPARLLGERSQWDWSRREQQVKYMPQSGSEGASRPAH